jgi:polar amino acid transport system ATP-binding protein
MAFVRRISHRVVMMDEGRVVETGPAEAVFGAPQQARTQAFMRAILRD